MKPSADPLVLNCNPNAGDPHPQSRQWRAINVRFMENADIEGKIVYAGPQDAQVVEAFVLRPTA
ncbi:MAG: hypothetical protein Q8M07_21070 [Prosthecobacter sp.]|nr:hypothetical protein [Prosthecobacter sp.]HBJ87537.1 hypothetical protein [Verrucomicrobiales bacterium]